MSGLVVFSGYQQGGPYPPQYNASINYMDLCPETEFVGEYDNEYVWYIWRYTECELLRGSGYTSEASFFEPLTEGQQLVCVILSRVASLLSIAGSCYISYCLLGPRREKELKKRLFSRLLLGLSICDAFSSLALVLGPWPKPSDNSYQDNHSDGSIWLKSLGNQATCNVQGLVIQTFYFASLYYTACLCLNFLFSVNYRWTESQLHAHLERWFHGVSILLPLVLGLVAYFFEMYNPAALNCSLTTSPLGCDADEDVDCDRGSNLVWWSMCLQFIPVIVCFSCILTCMVLIYRAVRAQEKAVARFSMREASKHWSTLSSSRMASSREISSASASSSQHLHKRTPMTSTEVQQKERSKDSRLAFGKAVLYIGVALAVWLPVFFIATCETFDVHIPYAVWVIRSIMTPIVGLLNALAYSGILSRTLEVAFRSVVSKMSTRSQNASNSQPDGTSGVSNSGSPISPSDADKTGGEEVNRSSEDVPSGLEESEGNSANMLAPGSSSLTVPLDQSTAFSKEVVSDEKDKEVTESAGMKLPPHKEGEEIGDEGVSLAVMDEKEDSNLPELSS